jgi:hypothetical protein
MPNGESAEAVAAYLGLVRRADRRPGRPDCARLWRDVGLDRWRISQIAHLEQRLLADDILVPRLHGAFERMVAGWDSRFNARPDQLKRLSKGDMRHDS